MPTTWQEVVALAAATDQMLHAQLLHDVHPVSLAPGRIEIRPTARAPRDLAGKLSLMLEKTTAARWMVGISREAGAPTLSDQGRAAAADRLAEARNHPLVQAILEAFPGAQLQEVRDAAADDYGLAGPAMLAPEPSAMPEFAPPEAEPGSYDMAEPAFYPTDDDEAPLED